MLHAPAQTASGSVYPPALVAVGSGFLSWLASLNWVGIIGVAVSGGWLVLGFLKHRFDVRKWEAERAMGAEGR